MITYNIRPYVYQSTDDNFCIEDYKEDLYSHEMGANAFRYTGSEKYRGGYAFIDEPEANPMDQLLVDISGTGFHEELCLERGALSITLWTDKMLSRMVVNHEGTEFTEINIKYGNVSTGRRIWVATANLDSYCERSKVLKVGSDYYMNDVNTITYFALTNIPGRAIHEGVSLPNELLKSKKFEVEFAEANKGLEGTGLYGYHCMSRGDYTSSRDKFRLGVEIEKISHLNDKISKTKLKEKFGIIKESDSSLGGNGAEYVTGIHNFKNIKPVLERIKHIINLPFPSARTKSIAGGHINVSQRGKTGFDLLRGLKCYMPLLFALYPDRSFRDIYSTACDTETMLKNPAKRAVFPKNELLEIRIFPAIDNHEDLLARIDLVEYMVKHQVTRYSSVITAVLEEGSELNTIIKRLTPNIKELMELFVVFSAVDSVKLTTTARKYLRESGVRILKEPKLTVTQWSAEIKKADKIPNQLIGCKIMMNQLQESR